MAILFQVTCLTLLLGMIYGWHSSYFFNEPFRSSSFDDSFDDDWFPSSEFEDIDRMVEESRQEFQQMANFSSSMFKTNDDEMINMKKKLDAVSPVCTTIENSPATQTFIHNNRRKQLRNTNTTTCIKELINGGMKYIYEEIKVTDDQNKTISQSNNYGSFTINTFNNMTSFNTTN